LASHLFLPPEEGRTDEDLARQMGDGAIWIGALDPLECYDPAGLRFRAVARGVRRLAGGRLERALPDLVWEDGLAAVFGRLLGTAGPAVVTACDDLLLGAVSTPLLAVAAAAGATLRPADDLTPRS
ncbi:MAG TPA: hypothetical protein VEG34_15065, partial [Thermoanaerobaculia bacterium]|nr:hypothetical protein [Thermoanaerobaculia bacterium]